MSLNRRAYHFALRQIRAAPRLTAMQSLAMVCALLSVLGAPSNVFGADSDWAARRERIQTLDPYEKAELNELWQRFQSLSPDERDRARTLYQQIEEDADSDELVGVLNRYHQWLSELPASEVAKLSSLTWEERIQRIKRLKAERANQVVQTLDSKDVTVLRGWLSRQMWTNEESLAAMNAQRQRMMERMSPKERETMQKMNLFGRYRHMGGPLVKWAAMNPQLPNWIDDDDLDSLRRRLSAEATRAIDPKMPIQKQKQIVVSWIRQLVRDRFQPRFRDRAGHSISHEALERFFENDLSESDREALLAMPREPMLKELQQRYTHHAKNRAP